MPGRHRARRRSRVVIIIVAALALVCVGTGTWAAYRQLVDGCAKRVSLTVAAAPGIAPAVGATAAGWSAGGATVDGACVTVEVAVADPAEVAVAVARQYGVSLTGLGGYDDRKVPDVWLPDSSTWLLRLADAATKFVPTNRASVARSPVVVGVPEPIADSFGWPAKKISWAGLLEKLTGGTGLHVGIVDPRRDAVGLSGLLAMTAAARAVKGDDQRLATAVLHAMSGGRSARRDDLLARFPGSTDPTSADSTLAVAPLSEKDVIAFNAKDPPVPLAALYLEPAPIALDYPYAVMPGIEPAKANAAEAFFARLGTADFRGRLGVLGLRAPDGAWGSGFVAPRNAPKSAGRGDTGPGDAVGGAGGVAGDERQMIKRALSTWTAVTMPARMLAVIDVSGSMLEPVPTAGNATRAQVTLAAAKHGLNLLDDSWEVGLWTFSTELVGGRDYRELVRIGPLASQRGRIFRALDSVVPKRDGDTGLYDTVLAAYRTMQHGWEAGKVNSVVLFTDGQNDDRHGISRKKLLTELKTIADPKKPIQVIIIGIGAGVDKDELADITEVTGGGVFVTGDPAKIGDILLQAIALRPALGG